jgi:formylglycine-generating enzyme
MMPTLTAGVEKTNMKRLYAMIAFAGVALGATLVGAQGPNQKDGQPAIGKVGLIATRLSLPEGDFDPARTNDPKAFINPIGPADGKGQGKDKVAAGGKGGISGTTVFRAYRLGLNHPGLAGRNLTPGRLLEDMKAALYIMEAESEPSGLTDLKAGDSRELAGVKLCWCPPGKFTMGSPPNEPERRPGEDQVKVSLTKGFWAGKYEVTQGQWKRVIGKLPGELTAELPEGDDYPVGNVNFAEAEEFCAKLTDLARKSGGLMGGWEFRLPTEAQWEYACRAGTTTATAFGDKLSSKQANVKNKPYNGAEEGPSRNRAAKVGSYPSNAWGLHDMHGNVVEWCRDWYHAKLPGGEDPDLHDAKATATANGDGTFSRSRRGSAWGDNASASRSALRQRFEPERRYDHIGFRVVAVQR